MVREEKRQRVVQPLKKPLEYIHIQVFCSYMEQVSGPEEGAGIYCNDSGITSQGLSPDGGLENTGEGACVSGT